MSRALHLRTIAIALAAVAALAESVTSQGKPSPRPDLVITKFGVNDKEFAVTVKNQGTAATPNVSIAVLVMPQGTPPILGVNVPLTLQIPGPLQPGES
jgi:hypothetical protein